MPELDVITMGPRVRRPLRAPDRRPARGHAVLREIRRRLPHQHGGRRRSPRPLRSAADAGRRRALRPLHPRDPRRGGRGRARRPHRPGAAHGARGAGDPRRRPVPAALLPRAVRRHGALRSGRRSELRRLGGLRCDHRYAPLAGRDRRRLPQGAAARARQRRAHRLRHRLPGRTSGDSSATALAKSATDPPRR